jgi:hypothetical protein
MSRWDEYDRMLERFEQGRKDIAENNTRAAMVPNDDVIENWNKKAEEVLSLIKDGVVKTDEWSINKANWVEFKTGSFRGRSLNVSNVVSEKRVLNYLKNHGLTVTPIEFSALMSDLNDLNAEKSKLFLKHYILQRKTSSQKNHYDVGQSPPSRTTRIRYDSLVQIQPRKKASLLSKIINYIFGD